MSAIDFGKSGKIRIICFGSAPIARDKWRSNAAMRDVASEDDVGIAQRELWEITSIAENAVIVTARENRDDD